VFVFINGAFGIGKTTVARVLRDQIAGAVVSDPEHVGFVLRRLPAFLLGLSQQPDDYQDMAIWRRLIVHQAGLAHRRGGTVLIPMAFTNLDYLDSFAAALERRAPVRRVCLVAPLEVVHRRLLERAAREGRTGLTAFEQQRSAECVLAHADPRFGQPVDAMDPPDVIAATIRRHMAK
jgi:chloramphenicol 3-O-phosphotransferase